MIDQDRSSVPENKAPYRSGSPSDMPPRGGNPKKRCPAGQVDIIAMVRSLQRTAGLTACFRTGNTDCDILDCDWRNFCVGTPADPRKKARRPKRK
jgi:hypothetical protein